MCSTIGKGLCSGSVWTISLEPHDDRGDVARLVLRGPESSSRGQGRQGGPACLSLQAVTTLLDATLVPKEQVTNWKTQLQEQRHQIQGPGCAPASRSAAATRSAHIPTRFPGPLLGPVSFAGASSSLLPLKPPSDPSLASPLHFRCAPPTTHSATPTGSLPPKPSCHLPHLAAVLSFPWFRLTPWEPPSTHSFSDPRSSPFIAAVGSTLRYTPSPPTPRHPHWLPLRSPSHHRICLH